MTTFSYKNPYSYYRHLEY